MALAPEQAGIGIRRHYTNADTHPFDQVEWERRDARISNWKTGEVAFEQLGVEFPLGWSLNATNIVAQKYFRGTPDTDEREWSLKQVADRVADTITDWGIRDGYFVSDEEAEAFRAELKFIIITQRAAFNSPVWFNIGVPDVAQQASACFIISVEDSIDDIWQLMGESARLFKFGSGVGADWSKLRSSHEILSGGGTPSGPVSFMKVQDATGGTIKSGGKTRRAAIMQTLKIWHPDIEEFIGSKLEEEKKAWALIEQGYDGSFNGPAYGSVAFQNVNQSVRVNDEFMAAADDNAAVGLRAVKSGEVIKEVNAATLLDKIAEGTHVCGDPGVQYEDTIQRWHTCKNHGDINSSNPCSEYMFLDDSACNLAGSCA